MQNNINITLEQRKNRHSSFGADSGIAIAKADLSLLSGGQDDDGLILPFSCFRHDVSASLVGNNAFLNSETSKPEEYSCRKLDNLINSLARFRAAAVEMQTASDQIIRALEEVGDAVPLSNIYSNELVTTLDQLVHLNSCISNINENMVGEMDTKVLAPLKDISKSIPILATNARYASSTDNSRRTSRSSTSYRRSMVQSRIDSKTEAKDRISHQQIPSILNLLSKQLLCQVDAIESTNEAVQKISIDRDDLSCLQPTIRDPASVSRGKTNDDRVGLESTSRTARDELMESYSPDKEFNMTFLNKLLQDW